MGVPRGSIVGLLLHKSTAIKFVTPFSKVLLFEGDTNSFYNEWTWKLESNHFLFSADSAY